MVGIKSALKISPAFSTTKVTLSQLLCRNTTSSNFLQYYSLLSAIPQKWKTMLKEKGFLPSTEYTPLSIEKLTCKTIYSTLPSHQHFPPPTAKKRLMECGFNFQERQKIYSLPFCVTNEVNLSVFFSTG